MAARMKLYNLESCPDCRKVREKLGKMQVTYTCVNVHPDKEKRKSVHKASGQHGVPVLVHKDRTMKSVRQIMQYLAEIKE